LFAPWRITSHKPRTTDLISSAKGRPQRRPLLLLVCLLSLPEGIA
jgi:hypothetical protein